MRWIFFLACIISFHNCTAQHVCVYDSLTRTEQWMYDGQLTMSVERRDPSTKDRHIIQYYDSGRKSQEFSERNGAYYDTLWQWTEEGLLHHLEIYSDTGFISIHFWYETGTILERGEFHKSGPVTEMMIDDTAAHIVHSSVTCGSACNVPSGVWYTFHENGMLESMGSYLPMKFISAEEMPGSPGTFIAMEGRLRDGRWIFYNEQGEVIREEFYEGGLLRKTIEFH